MIAAEGSAVPRFYFHTNLPSEGTKQDNVGFEFASVHEAKCQAAAYAGRLLEDKRETFWDDGDFELIVTNEDQLILFVMNVHGTTAPALLAKLHLLQSGS
jgi:hypothetical protein